jgi:hypothetical protein
LARRNLLRLLAIAGVFSALAGSCGVAPDSSPVTEPVVRVAVGMSVEDLRRGSTYPFAADAQNQGDTDLGSFVISQRFALELGIGEAKLALANIGGPHESTFIVTRGGVVAGVVCVPQSRLLTLSEAIALVDRIDAFADAAGLEGASNYHVQDARRDVLAPSIASIQDAEAALADTSLQIGRMNVLNAQGEDISLSVNIMNANRLHRLMRAEPAAPRESDALERAWPDARSYAKYVSKPVTSAPLAPSRTPTSPMAM